METQTKQEYTQKVRAEYDKLNAQIEELKAKAAQQEAQAKIQYSDQLEELRAKQEALQMKLQDLHNASEAAWRDLCEGVDRVWLELETTVKKIVANFNLSSQLPPQTEPTLPQPPKSPPFSQVPHNRLSEFEGSRAESENPQGELVSTH